MTVQVELYRREEALESEEGTEATRRRELVEKLGFNPQLQLVEEVGNEATCFYPELTGYELEVWTLFHRTHYRKSKKEWSGYHFDRVPTDVLEAIYFADGFGGFDDLELWTPEHGRKLDPMAVGVVGHRLGRREQERDLGGNAAFNSNARFFPIVRWGESLMALEEIAERVLLSRFKHNSYRSRRRPAITQAILDFARPFFKADPRQQLTYWRAGMFTKHCGEHMVMVMVGEEETTICGACGAH